MSEIRDILAGSIIERQTYTGETVKHLRTGKSFVAEYQENQNIELNEALGRDPRESATLHVADRVIAALIAVNDQLQITFYGTTSTFMVLQSRTDNPGSSQVQFGLMKLSNKDAA